MLTDQLRHWSHGHHGHHWSPGTQAGYLSFQWSKWAGKKNLRKNLVFWPTFFFDQFHKTHWSHGHHGHHGHQAHRQAISASSGWNDELGKKMEDSMWQHYVWSSHKYWDWSPRLGFGLCDELYKNSFLVLISKITCFKEQIHPSPNKSDKLNFPCNWNL